MYYKLLTRTLFFALFAFATQLSAQNTAPHREVGLQFSGLNLNNTNSFSAFFKKQKKEHVYQRLRLFYGNINGLVRDSERYLAFFGGIAIGHEKRKSLDSKLEFYQGPELSAALSIVSIIDENTDISIRGGFGWVLGLQHSFNERWAVNLEAIPGLSMNVNGATKRDVTTVGWDASISNSVSLGLVRKF